MKQDDATVISSIQDIEAIEVSPLETHIGEFNSTYDILVRGARLFPKRIALRFLETATIQEDPVDLNYTQLLKRVTQAANLFHDFGIGEKDVVSFLLPNLPQTHLVLWGAEATGIVNPINPLLEVDQMVDILNAAESKILVALGPQEDEGIWEKVEEIRSRVPTIKSVFQVCGAGDEGNNIFDFDALLENQPDDHLVSKRTFSPDDIAAYFHTGGTTGTPKLAQHTHRNEIYEAWVLTKTLELTEQSILFCGLPLFHVNAVIVTGITAFYSGAQAVVLTAMGYRHPQVIPNFWALIEKYQASIFVAVPTVFSSLLQVALQGENISTLKYAVCGAAPMPVKVFRDFERITGIKIFEGYGLTEGTCVSSANPLHGKSLIGSIGLRLPYQPMKVVELDSEGKYLRDCQVNEIGTLVIKGPNVFPGYKQEKHNKNLWVDQGWINTGDLARMDEQQYFWLTGRTKELIIRSGHNIDPAIIEDALQKHPSVSMVAAIGQLDVYAGEKPMAYVVLKADQTTTPDELLDFAKIHVQERAAIPIRIEILDALPLTAVGKIFKPQLHRMAASFKLREVLEPLAMGPYNLKVEVVAHEKFGTLAKVYIGGMAEIELRPLQEKVTEQLGLFALNHELIFGDKQAD